MDKEQKQPFTVKGQFKNYAHETLRIGADTFNTDAEGRFIFTSHDSINTVHEIMIYFGTFKRSKYTIPVMCFVAPGETTTITGDADNRAQIKLDDHILMNKELNEFNSHQEKYMKQVAMLYEQLHEIGGYGKKFDSAKLRSVRIEFDTAENRYDREQEEYINLHPDQELSAFLISISLYDYSFKDLQERYNHFSPAVQNSVYGSKIKRSLDLLEKSAIGHQAPAITGYVDAHLDSINLSQYLGKYVLLDFWGSWCHWCREANPSLLNYYRNYQQDGFEIIGIACRDKREDWLHAIQKDNLTWRQILNADNHNNDLVGEYAIFAFPTAVLIDPHGIVIYRSIGDDPVLLGNELKQIFKH
ncbi:MAG: TlpA disulfide reductase family protein [Phycisphaerales bacterium]|nr:TlpA disulfide reductase family protein [Phycisphaerales bacterium]